MLRETERLYDAIDALCGKRKAKLLKKLVRKAIAAEKVMANVTFAPGTFGTGDIQITTDAHTGNNPYVAGVTLT